MKALRIISVSLAGFFAVAGAWYVNAWDYESAYSRGLLDGARVGFVKGHQKAIEELNEQLSAEKSGAEPRMAAFGAGPA